MDSKRKKKEKMRGHRSHGKGNTKNKRGAGCRGGRGKGGSKKHKFTKYYMEFGAKRTLKAKPQGKAINLSEINFLLEKIQEKENGFIVFDGIKTGYSKILSKGTLNQKVLFKNVTASKKAIEKINESDSKIQGLEETEFAEDEEFEAEEETDKREEE
ncbi:MAG: uL15 family ribosomal protein [Candidatus Diapherotrites archaeon]|nr:uL15 family ribosomal protein [Candidatus Diapherotrites archaeon]